MMEGTLFQIQGKLATMFIATADMLGSITSQVLLGRLPQGMESL
jgi:hypothetical protein